MSPRVAVACCGSAVSPAAQRVGRGEGARPLAHCQLPALCEPGEFEHRSCLRWPVTLRLIVTALWGVSFCFSMHYFFLRCSPLSHQDISPQISPILSLSCKVTICHGNHLAVVRFRPEALRSAKLPILNNKYRVSFRLVTLSL